MVHNDLARGAKAGELKVIGGRAEDPTLRTSSTMLAADDSARARMLLVAVGSDEPGRNLRGSLQRSFGYLLGRVLEIVVHCHDNSPLGDAEAAEEGVVLSAVPEQANDSSAVAGMLLECFQNIPRFVRTAIIHDDDFISLSQLLES